MNRFVTFFAGAAVLGLVIGCAEAPKQSLEEAKAALDSAKTASADVFCKEQFEAARSSYDLAVAALQEQEKKLPFMRDYVKVSELLAASRSAAAAAKADVEVSKEKIRVSTTAAITDAQVIIDSLLLTIAEAQKKKMDVSAWTASVDSSKAQLASASELLGSGALIGASEKAAAVRERVVSVKKDIEVLVVPGAK